MAAPGGSKIYTPTRTAQNKASALAWDGRQSWEMEKSVAASSPLLDWIDCPCCAYEVHLKGWRRCIQVINFLLNLFPKKGWLLSVGCMEWTKFKICSKLNLVYLEGVLIEELYPLSYLGLRGTAGPPERSQRALAGGSRAGRLTASKNTDA